MKFVDLVDNAEHCNKHLHLYSLCADEEDVSFVASVAVAIVGNIETKGYVNLDYELECFDSIVVDVDDPLDEEARKMSIAMF